VIINASCTFLIPVNYPATVRGDACMRRTRPQQCDDLVRALVEGDDRLYAEGAAKVVWMDPRTGKSVPIPDALRHAVS
jgi:acyl-CoA thioester hydrolase